MASSKGKEKVEETDNNNDNNQNNNQNNGHENNNNRGTNVKLGPFPPGFRFEPTDEELVKYYLVPKVEKKELPPNNMHEIDLYDPNNGDEHNPQRLSECYIPQGDREWYFFTLRDRKYQNGKRPNRASGGGFWKASGKDEVITSRDGTSIGLKKTLVFYCRTPTEVKKTNWIMHEFRLDVPEDPPNKTHVKKNNDAPKPERVKLGTWVLCRIRYNTKGDKRVNVIKEEEEEEDDKSPKKAKCESSSDNSPQKDVPTTSHGNVMMPIPAYYNAGHQSNTPMTILPYINVTDIPSTSNYTPVDVKTNNGLFIAQNSNYTTEDAGMISADCNFWEAILSRNGDYPIDDNNFRWSALTIQTQNTSYLNQVPHWSQAGSSNFIPSISNPDISTTMAPPSMSYYPTDQNANWNYKTATDVPSSSNSIPEDANITKTQPSIGVNNNPTHSSPWSFQMEHLPSTSRGIYNDNQITKPFTTENPPAAPGTTNTDANVETGDKSGVAQSIDFKNPYDMDMDWNLSAQSPLPDFKIDFEDDPDFFNLINLSPPPLPTPPPKPK